MKDQKQYWDEAHKQAALSTHSKEHTNFAEDSERFIAAHAQILEGNDSIYFAQQGYRIIATDFSEVLIEQNQSRYNHPNLQFRAQDTSHPFAFSDAQFDAVYARLSLHYFTDTVTRQVFAEITRVLKLGGKLCFMCKTIDDRLYGQGIELEPDMFELKGHVRHFFSEDYVKALLAQRFTTNWLKLGQEELYGKVSGFIKVIATKA